MKPPMPNARERPFAPLHTGESNRHGSMKTCNSSCLHAIPSPMLCSDMAGVRQRNMASRSLNWHWQKAVSTAGICSWHSSQPNSIALFLTTSHLPTDQHFPPLSFHYTLLHPL